MYKTYRYRDVINNGVEEILTDNYITLEAPLLVGEWVFDELDYLPTRTLDAWSKTLVELENILELVKHIFEVKYVNYEINIFNEKNKISSHDTVPIEEVKDDIFNIIKDPKYVSSDNYGLLDVTICCKGECYINERVKVHSNLFNICLGLNNHVYISVETYNFCFLPHHPVTKTRQYDIWKNNAPKLALLLSEYAKNTKLELITDIGEMYKFGYISENIFYLSNRSISVMGDDSWDEFYIPFDLLPPSEEHDV